MIMIAGIFLVSLLAAFGMDAARDGDKIKFTRGQADALYMIMIVSLLGLVVTVSGLFAV